MCVCMCMHVCVCACELFKKSVLQSIYRITYEIISRTVIGPSSLWWCQVEDGQMNTLV